MSLYYITVGKRKTRIALRSISRCFEVSNLLNNKLSRDAVVGLPEEVPTDFWQSRPANEAARAAKILTLIL